MLSLEEQLNRIADAAFEDVPPVRWTPDASPSRPRRHLVLAAAAGLLAILVGGLVITNQRDTPEPVLPAVTAADIDERSTTGTEPSITLETPASTIVIESAGTEIERVDPYNRAFESMVGVSVGELNGAIVEAEKRTLAQCMTGRGWVVTSSDLWQIGYRAGLPYDVGTGYASNALANDRRGQRYQELTLRGDEQFVAAITECSTTIGDELPEIRALIDWFSTLPYHGVGADSRYLAARDAAAGCLESIGLSGDLSDKQRSEFSDRTQEFVALLAGTDLERSEAIDRAHDTRCRGDRVPGGGRRVLRSTQRDRARPGLRAPCRVPRGGSGGTGRTPGIGSAAEPTGDRPGASDVGCGDRPPRAAPGTPPRCCCRHQSRHGASTPSATAHRPSRRSSSGPRETTHSCRPLACR